MAHRITLAEVRTVLGASVGRLPPQRRAAVEFVRADTSVEQYEAAHGGPLYNKQPDKCCLDRKVVPLRRAVAGYEAWISAIRRDQTTHRSSAGVAEWDKKFGLVKVNPLVTWTKKDVWKFIADHNIRFRLRPSSAAGLWRFKGGESH